MMSSNEIRKGSKRQSYPTVPFIRMECDDEDIKNATYDGILTGMVKDVNKKKQNNSVGSDIEEGKRIRDIKKKTWYEKGILALAYYGETVDKNKKVIKIILEYVVRFFFICVMGCSALENTIRIAQQIQSFSETDPRIMAVVWLIYEILFKYCKYILKKEKKRIQELGKLPYPIMFFNGEKKLKSWMRFYIKYCEQNRPKNRFDYYIGSGKIEERNLTAFIIPDKYPEWGAICLCQLVRNLSGRIWNGIYREESGTTESAIDEKFLEEDVPRTYILPDDDLLLRGRLQQAKVYCWNYARADKHEDNSMLFPIENSIYLLYMNKSEYGAEYAYKRAKKINGKIQEISKSFPLLRFWCIISDTEKTFEILDRYNEISDDTLSSNMLEKIWSEIVRLLESIQDNTELHKKLYEQSEKKWIKSWEGRASNSRVEFSDFYEKVPKIYELAPKTDDPVRARIK